VRWAPVVIACAALQVHAQVQHYQGTLTIEAVSGGACGKTALGSVRKIDLVIEPNADAKRLAGYFMGERIAPGKIVGEIDGELDVAYPYVEEEKAKGHRLRIHTLTGESLVAELREKHLHDTVANCNYDRAKIVAKRKGSVAEGQQMQEQATTAYADGLEESQAKVRDPQAFDRIARNLRAAQKAEAALDWNASARLRAEILPDQETLFGQDGKRVGAALHALAETYHQLGYYDKSVVMLQRALAIRERRLGPTHRDTATTLNNLALSLRNIGRIKEAEDLYRRVLAADELTLGPIHEDVGADLGNLAELLHVTGRYGEAEPLYRRALAIFQNVHGAAHPRIATALGNLGSLMRITGRLAEAESFYRNALNMMEATRSTEHVDVATSLGNLAGLLAATDRAAEAEPLYQKALAIDQTALGPQHPRLATDFNNLAEFYRTVGRERDAEPLYRNALAIYEAAHGAEHPLVGAALNNLAGLLNANGRHGDAESLCRRAYGIALKAGEPALLQTIQGNLSHVLKKQGKIDAAIFFGKQAVNTLQSLRANVAELGKDTLKSYDATIEGTYRHLSSLLIDQSRLVEAERVLELLKDQEQFEFVRRDASLVPTAGKAPLTAFEAAQSTLLDAAGAPLDKIKLELAALEDKQPRSAADEIRLQALRHDFDQASVAFQNVFDQILGALAATRRDKADDLKEAQGLQDTLRELGDKLGESVVALYTVVDQESYSLILITADYRRAYTVPIKAVTLNGKIASWRNALKSKTLDPTMQARELLDLILPPAAREELRQAKVGTLMWHLDGELRLLPLAALHDGERYLIERYRLTTFTPASTAHLTKEPKARWNGLGLGVSEARTVEQKSFTALPAVAKELETVIRQDGRLGVIPGTRHLNAEFNWVKMQDELKRKGKYPLIHIASHFNLEPGNDTMSYLLPGAGDPITLALIMRQNNLFGGVDLLTLSACETGIGGGKGADGREVDGLSFIAQRQGARAVMATLWPVADASTALLMERFYQLRETQQLSKAEALRQAQLALLTGKAGGTAIVGAGVTAPESDGSRGASVVGRKTAVFSADPNAPYAHPYFWAPFILMGNWL